MTDITVTMGDWIRQNGEFKKVLKASKNRVVLQTVMGKEEILVPHFKNYTIVNIEEDEQFRELMRDTAHEILAGRYRSQVLEAHAYRLLHDWEHRDWIPDILSVADKNNLLFEPLAAMEQIEEDLTLHMDTISHEEKMKAMMRSYQRQQALFAAETKRQIAKNSKEAAAEEVSPIEEQEGCSGHCGSCSGHATPALPAPVEKEKPKEKPFSGRGFGDNNQVRY